MNPPENNITEGLEMKDNRIIVDLSKVQWARFGYRNQEGMFSPVKPHAPTVHGLCFNIDEHVFGCEESTMLEYATENKLLDVWTPELQLKITANTWLTYTGDKAISLYEAYRERIFNKKK